MTAPEPTLRELAAAATPGPWSIMPGANGNVWRFPDEGEHDQVPRVIVRQGGMTQHNAAFIAAANPAAVLALLDRAEAAEAERDALAAKVARIEVLEPTWPRGMYGCPDDMFSRRDLRAALRDQS